jgi:hypothetical protein
MRLPLGFADSASVPSGARSRPSKLLLLLFLLNREFEFSSIDASVASSSDNKEGQLSSKCLNASDFITAANIKEFYWLNTSTYSRENSKYVQNNGISLHIRMCNMCAFGKDYVC